MTEPEKEEITTSVQNLQRELAFNRFIESIPVYRGENDKCREFLNLIEISVSLKEKSDIFRARAALVRSKGFTKEVIDNYVLSKTDTELNWEELKKLIEENFGRTADKGKERSILHSVRFANSHVKNQGFKSVDDFRPNNVQNIKFWQLTVTACIQLLSTLMMRVKLLTTSFGSLNQP